MARDLFSGILPFVHTARQRSYRRAAAELGVTPAAVSKSVMKLEDDLGAKLLARTSRTVNLTPEGRRFLERCEQAIASLEIGRELVTESKRMPRGELHVSMSFILARVVMPELPRLSSRYPELSLRVSTTDRLAKLVDEGVDVALRVGEPTDKSLVGRRLRASRWVTVAAPGYLARAGTPEHPADLARHNCLSFVGPNGKPRPWSFVDATTGRPATMRVAGNLAIDQGDYLLEAGLAGQGLCQVLDFMVGEHVRAGRLVEVLGPHAAEGPAIFAISPPERRRSANVRAFVASMVDAFARA
jgi:LysR family transcriptional regulator for bpeEF and oprC